jgi:peptide/nickel transport system permease protein
MKYLTRIGVSIPLLLVISLGVFALIHLIPGGPMAVYLSSPGVRPEDLARLTRALGLDQPLWRQYLQWLGGFAVGEWGFSFSDGRPVIDRVAERLPATIELISASLMVALVVTAPLGIIPAIRRGWVSRSLAIVSFAGISLPVFWFGLVLQLIFAVGLGWLPSSGRTTPGDGGVLDRTAHLLLPAAMLGAVHAAAWARYLRASIVETLGQPFVNAARARGVPEGLVLARHTMRPALLPALTVVLLDAALMVAGTVVTESVFAWPGLGGLFTEALARRDYTVLMAMLMLASTAVVFCNLVADLLYPLLDPRVRT